MTQLIAYIFVAMMSWVPVQNLMPYGETEAEVRARYMDVATDIVTVAMDASEPPVFARTDGRVKTALLQAAIVSKETGFQRFVDDGTCNRPGYHADRRGDCDGGHAWSLWQIHVFGGGYLLLDDGTLGSVTYNADLAKAHPEMIIGGVQLVADRKAAVRVAQRLERNSLKNYHSLCAYSGEPCADGRHPKAEIRYNRAVEYYTAHPFTAPIPEPVVVASVSSSSIQTSSD